MERLKKRRNLDVPSRAQGGKKKLYNVRESREDDPRRGRRLRSNYQQGGGETSKGGGGDPQKREAAGEGNETGNLSPLL